MAPMSFATHRLPQRSSPPLKKAPASHSYEILSLELSLLANVRDFLRGFSTRVAERDIPPVRTLILNTGYSGFGQQSLTDEGFDTSFVANYLGHWLLTMMLLQSMDRENGRIVGLGSSSYEFDGYYKDEKWKTFFRDENIDPIAKGTWSSNKDDLSRRAGVRRYGVAMMCAIMMVGELQRRLDTDPILKNISITGIGPGMMGTSLVRRDNWFTRVLLWPIILPLLAPLLTWLQPNGDLRTVSQSSADVLTAAFETSPELRGKYLNGSEPQEVVREAADIKKRAMVWRDSVKYAQLTEQDTTLVNWT
ncbi:hypothetical protein DL768_003778 [Monosporascus sp. mg162]|nr:hypothetical protein DL768_003778 [Monosporascus sp. mg162]